MTRIIILAVVAAIVSCHSSGDREIGADTASSVSDSAAAGNDPKTSETIDSSGSVMEGDSIINIKFATGATSATVSAELKGIGHPVTVMIPVKQGKELSAKIVPEDSTANIRINQIFFPDGKADGPFGRDLKRAIDQQGTYKLIIGENMMQGDEWKGKFSLTIAVR